MDPLNDRLFIVNRTPSTCEVEPLVLKPISIPSARSLLCSSLHEADCETCRTSASYMRYLVASGSRSRSRLTFSLPLETYSPCFRSALYKFWSPNAVVLVEDGAAVIIHTVVKQVNVWMFTVVVATDDELRVANPHALHVFLCNGDHRGIVEPLAVLCRKVKRDMSDRTSNPCVEPSLGFKTSGD